MITKNSLTIVVRLFCFFRAGVQVPKPESITYTLPGSIISTISPPAPMDGLPTTLWLCGVGLQPVGATGESSHAP